MKSSSLLSSELSLKKKMTDYLNAAPTRPPSASSSKKTSKLSSLLNFIEKMTTELNYENFYRLLECSAAEAAQRAQQ